MVCIFCMNSILAKTLKHKYNVAMNKKFKSGAIQGSTIAIILLTLALIAAGSAAIWAFINYREAQSNLDDKVSSAVSEARREQAAEDDEKFAEREKQPSREFAGAPDYGHVTFMYPKTWSVFEAADGSDGKDYYAYLHPIVVPPVPASSRDNQRFAMRVVIYNNSMDAVLKEYERTIEAGELSSSQVITNGKSGTRLTGLFPGPRDDRIRGMATFYKVNDKTLMVRTDAETFQDDYNKILNTINFD